MPWQQSKKTGAWREIDENGRPTGRTAPATPTQAPQQGAIPIGPRNTQRAQENARADRADARAEEAAQRSAEAEARAQRGEDRTLVTTKFDQEGKLRDDFNQNVEVKAYRASLPMLAQALKAPKNGQGDLSVIYAYAKLMDPGSVVREGEMDMVVNSSPYAQSIAQKWLNQLDGSGRLPPAARRSLEQEMIRTTQARRKSYETQYNRYTANAESMGLDPQMVVGPHEGEAFRSDMQAYDKERGLGRFAGQKPNPFEGLPGKSNTDGGLYDAQGNFIAPDPRRLGIDPATYTPPPGVLYRYKDENGNWVNEESISGSLANPYEAGLNLPPNYEQQLIDTVKAQTGDPTSAQNWIMRAANGGLFGFSDEVNGLKAGGKALINGQDPMVAYRVGRDLEQMRQHLNEKGQGWKGTALEIGASIPTSLALPFGRVSNIPEAMKAGAVIGAVDGAGRGNGVSGTAMSIAGGALGGTLGGGAAGAAGKYVVAPVARKVMESKLGQSVAQRLASAMGKTPNPLPALTPEEAALNKVGADMAGVRGNIAEAENLGLPYALADADPRLRMLGGTVSRQSPEAYAVAENYLGPRSLGQIDRLKGELDQLAPLTNVSERGDQILKAGDVASSPYYEMAKGASAPVDAELAAMLRTPSGQDALMRAQNIMKDRGIDPNGKRIFFDSEGLLTVEKKPSFETLDYVKRGLDARLNEARNPITNTLDLRGNPQLSAVNDLRGRMVSKLDSLNPNYPQARATYAKFAQRKEALDGGYSLPGMLPRDADTFVARLTPDTLPEAQRGFSTALSDKAEKLRYTANPYEATYGSPAQQQRIATMFPEGADRFGKVFNRERDMTKTVREVLGGSPTALRQGMDQAMAPQLATATEMFGQANGLPGAGVATMKGLNWFAKRGIESAAKKNAEKLAPVLFTDTANINALGLIDALIAKNARRADFTNNVARRSGLFGAAIAPAFAPSF